MYGWMDVRQLSNRKISHILTHTKEFFLTADLALPKLTPPPDRIGQNLPLTRSFRPFPRIKWCIYWPNLKAIHAFSRELWPFKKNFFSTFLYILQFSNANNSLNKQDRNSFKFKNSFIFGHQNTFSESDSSLSFSLRELYLSLSPSWVSV